MSWWGAGPTVDTPLTHTTRTHTHTHTQIRIPKFADKDILGNQVTARRVPGLKTEINA